MPWSNALTPVLLQPDTKTSDFLKTTAHCRPLQQPEITKEKKIWNYFTCTVNVHKQDSKFSLLHTETQENPGVTSEIFLTQGEKADSAGEAEEGEDDSRMCGWPVRSRWRCRPAVGWGQTERLWGPSHRGRELLDLLHIKKTNISAESDSSQTVLWNHKSIYR